MGVWETMQRVATKGGGNVYRHQEAHGLLYSA